MKKSCADGKQQGDSLASEQGVPTPLEAVAAARTVGAVLMRGSTALAQTSLSPRLDAELLWCAVAQCSRLECIAKYNSPVPLAARERFIALLARRMQHEPVAYLTGTKEFFGHEFEVSSSVLIPRPETELLIEHALERSCSSGGHVQIADLGTGSGCIVVSIVKELAARGQSVSAVAVDRSIDALQVARRNAACHGVSSCIQFLCADWLSAFSDTARFNLITCNPPYVAIGDEHCSPELRHEPPEALFAAQSGLSEIARLLPKACAQLHPGGRFLCEIGSEQGVPVTAMAEKLLAGRGAVTLLQDLAEHDRLVRIDMP